MLFYCFCFLLFFTCYKFAEKTGHLWLVILTALLPALFEGLRYQYLGTDMSVYGTLYFEDVKYSKTYIEAVETHGSTEYGFFFIIYLAKLIHPSVHMYMFLCGLVKACIVYYVAFDNRKRMSTFVFLLSYFMMFYFYGFNLIRQTIAIAIALLAFNFWLKEKYKYFVITVLIDMLFHNSAFMLFFIPIVTFFQRIKFGTAINIMGAIAIFILVKKLMDYMLLFGLYTEKVELYMDSGVPMAKTDFLLCLFYAFVSFLTCYLYKRRSDQSGLAPVAFIASIYALVFLVLSNYIEVAFRIAYYFEIFLMLVIPIFIYQRRPKPRLGLYLIFSLLLILHFGISCKNGLGESVPYKSDIMNIR